MFISQMNVKFVLRVGIVGGRLILAFFTLLCVNRNQPDSQQHKIDGRRPKIGFSTRDGVGDDVENKEEEDVQPKVFPHGEPPTGTGRLLALP